MYTNNWATYHRISSFQVQFNSTPPPQIDQIRCPIVKYLPPPLSFNQHFLPKNVTKVDDCLRRLPTHTPLFHHPR